MTPLPTRLLVGGYTADADGRATGIRLLAVGPDGQLEDRGDVVATDSPTALIANGDHVYAVAERAGRLDSFRWAGDRLRAVASEPTAGSIPCHLSLIRSSVLVSCFGDGMLSRHPLATDGAAGPIAQAIMPDETTPAPHAEATLELPDGAVISTDLGADLIYRHRQEPDGTLVRSAQVAVRSGSGPRHILRHESGSLYVNMEFSNEIVVLSPELEVLSIADSVGPGAGLASEIAFGPGGKYVYLAIRGADVIAVFEVIDAGRRLLPRGAVSSGGLTPRHFIVVADHLYVANQDSDLVAHFVLGSDGMPEPVGTTVVPSPTCLLALSPLGVHT